VTRGVYFLASDRILDLAIAFLNSFRAHNPDVPLCMIPYNPRHARVAQLASAYGFTMFPRPDLLDRCEAVGRFVLGREGGRYRKLALWEGDFDEFVYIDTDTVVLHDVTFCFDHLADHDFVTSHSHDPGLLQWVWKPTVRESGRLTKDQIDFSANTGFIVSRKPALRLEESERRQGEAAALAPWMEAPFDDQPLLNYLMVTSGRRYSSLSWLRESGAHPSLPREVWAGQRGGVVEGGRISFASEPGPVLLVHWAGQWQPRRIDAFPYAVARALRLKPPTSGPVLRRRMPYRALWRHYRYLRD
jgi:hypothetical protein